MRALHAHGVRISMYGMARDLDNMFVEWSGEALAHSEVRGRLYDGL